MSAHEWFTAEDYLKNKLATKAVSDAGITDLPALMVAFEKAGFVGADGAYKHFQMYGNAEGISPNKYFNATQYLQAKAADALGSASDYNVGLVASAIAGLGMSAWDHYQKFGATEGKFGINPSNAFDQETYLNAKAALVGKTATEVKDAITNAGMTVLQHYMQFAGQTGEVSLSTNVAVPADKQVGGTTGRTFTLTNGTDTATANVFNSGLVYVPGGNDRINALQNEDVLTGAAGRTDNTLNVTLGNANDNGLATVTPYLNGIQNINIDWTGNTTTLDLRNADATESINIKRVTADATTVNVNNIGTPAATLRVANTASDNVNVTFQYKTGVLNGAADVAALELNDVLANSVNQTSRANVEGFETVNLTVANGVDINALSVNDMENLNITGSGDLTIVNLTATANEYDAFTAGGIANPGSIGLRTVNAADFTGNLNVDVSAALGGFVDPTNSGAQAHTVITGGSGNDKFWTNAGVAATSATNRDQINGGAGNNTLVVVGGNIAGNAAITNVQGLELRTQAGNTTVDFDAFDANLASVLLRDEKGVGATAFTLNDLGADLASSGNIVLHHGITGHGAQTVAVNLKADTANDTVAITVENDRNTGTTFNYTIDADVPTPTGKVDADQGVENVTINDNDTETNVVTLTSAAEHKGTVTLTGGVAGQSYTVASTLVAKTVDAAAQKSNLVLTVGVEDQAIKLGSGDDRLTFDGLDTFNGSDAITDVGGTDTVRAAFSKDVTGTPELAGIENLHIVATANAALDLAKGTNLTQLVLMSNEAVDENNEVFSAGIALGQVNLTDVITLKNTKLSEVNFFGDEDAVNPLVPTTVATIQNFNGLTLENNTGDAVAVKIGAPLQNLTNLAGNGITAYNLGQLTTHGVKDLSIVVSNEIANNGTTTTIANIWDRDLVNLTLTATGNVNVGTVTGNTVNSNIKTVNASAVGGNTTATVKALGDSAVVTLAGGNDVFNALGSAGNNVTIQAGEGNNTVTGTAQSDYIYSGAGRDVIDANRGNNTVKSGAGDDTVAALNGSNTVDLGSGKADAATFNYDTAGQQNLATNVIAGSGTNATINIVNGGVDGLLSTAVDNVTTTYGFAVGDGAEASLKFTGITFDATASTLNGRSAINVDGVAVAPTNAGVIGAANYDANQSNLVVFTVNPTAGQSFTGGSAADVFMDISAGVGTAYNVSTGAGNDAIVIAQTNTGAHTITGGTGADRVVLSAAAAAGVNTVVLAEGDSTASAWDVITNFKTGVDKLDLSSFTTGTAAKLTSTAWADLAADADAAAETVAVDAVTGEVTIGLSGGGNAVIGKDVSVASVINYLAANSTTVNDTFFFRYDSNGTGAIDAADSAVFFQNLGTDLVVELVGSATNSVAGFSVATDLV